MRLTIIITNMSFLKRIFLLSLCLISHHVFSIDLPELLKVANDKAICKGKNTLLYVDSTNSLSESEILSLIYTKSIPWDKESTVYNGASKGKNTWMLFEVVSEDAKELLLEIPDFHVGYVELFEIKNKNLESLGKQGFFEPFKNRPYNYKNPIFSIHPKEKTTYLIRMNSEFGSSYKIYLQKNTPKLNFISDEYLRLGFFYGILILMLFYNFLIFLISKDKTYLYYVGYVFACVFYSFFTDGIGFQYLWGAYPSLNYLYNLSEILLILSFSLYSIQFISIKIDAPKIYLGLLLSLSICFIFYIINQCLNPFDQLSTWITLLPYALIIIALAKGYKEGKKELRFFIIAYSFLVLGIIIHILMRKEIFPDNFIGIYSVNIGFILEIIFLSLAQGDRVRLIRNTQIEAKELIIEKQKENELLKDEVNRELENLVAKRTTQLEQKVNEIKELNDKINQMNLALDKNLWQAKKEVVNTKKEGLLESHITYDTFKKSFPDNTTCIRLIADKKWKDEFVCKKCGNKKHNKNDNFDSKKCTKCNTVESFSANTVFHGLRFPIQKALYILIVSFRKLPNTNQELAEELDLREATVSSFRKKIKDKIKKEQPKSFEDLLL